jgi:NADH-quinone oxidoreductase subunit C
VDTGALLSKIDEILGEKVLEKGRFGRSQSRALWVESKSLGEVAQKIKENEEMKLDWLENLSAIQMDESLVLSYFIGSRTTDHFIIIRSSLVPENPSAEVSAPSVVKSWPMAGAFEAEISSLFGISFEGSGQIKSTSKRDGRSWEGFPLRKSYALSGEKK